MKLFAPLYARALVWARNERAPTFLGVLSFAEAIIFPIMPEVMLAPMCLAQPRRGFLYATISLAGSMLGAVVGYLLGHYAFEAVRPALEAMGMLGSVNAGIATVQAKMAQSPWAVFGFLVLGGFMPIPMKVFTWASGIVGVPWLPYLASMAVGRGKRVFLVALAIRLGGERAERALHKYIEPVGWAVVVLVLALLAWLLLRGHAA